MTAAMLAGLAASLLQLAAYVVYLAQALRADCRPNAMSWVMWACGTAVLLGIELHIGAPLSVLLLPGVCLLCSLVIIAQAFTRGERLPPEPQDWLVLGVYGALTLGYVAMVLRTPPGEVPGGASIFVALTGAITLASSWPILRTTYVEPSNERPLAWFVWSAAYGLLTLAAMGEGLPWPFLVYPLVCQIVHVLIGLFAMERDDSAAASAAPGSGLPMPGARENQAESKS